MADEMMNGVRTNCCDKFVNGFCHDKTNGPILFERCALSASVREDGHTIF